MGFNSGFKGLIPVVQIQLNLFRASSCPSSEATTTAVAASGLPLERGGSSDVGRGRAGCLYVGMKSVLCCE